MWKIHIIYVDLSMNCQDASVRGVDDNIKKCKERLIREARKSIGNISVGRQKPEKLGNRNEKKNNCIDSPSDKLTRLRTRRPDYG